MAATIPQGDWLDLARGTPRSPPLIALNEADKLGQGYADPVNLDPIFRKYISDQVGVTASSTPPLVPGPLRDENFNPFLEQVCTTTTAQDSNEGMCTFE